MESHAFLERVKKVHNITTPKKIKELNFKDDFLKFWNKVATENGIIIFSQLPA